MKPLFIALLSLSFVSSAFATLANHPESRDHVNAGLHQGQSVPWQNIEVKQKLFLTRDVKLSDQVLFKKGSRFVVTEVTSLDMINVELYELSMDPCNNGMKQKSVEMKMVDELYGVTLEPQCKVGVYVELVDFSRPSLFTLKPLR